ncbi:MAG: hypothetical protein INQ03_09055 [Candidatus Heimdallarchaeota archaeon]|nr:hypothetical protein [Candidatus Heimdallarchaeota archaeon]
MYEILNSLVLFIKDLSYFLLVASLLPYLLQIIIHILTSFINRTFKFRINPILNVIALPAAIIKNVPVNLYLMLKGWDLSITYFDSVGKSSSNLSSSGLNSFTFSHRPGYRDDGTGKMVKQDLTSWDSIFIMINSYVMTFLIFLWFDHLGEVMDFLVYVMGVQASYFTIILLSISFVLGGLPTPGETMLPIVHYFKKKPHMVFSFISAFVGVVILNAITGPAIATSVYMIAVAIYLLLDTILERRDDTVISGFPVL